MIGIDGEPALDTRNRTEQLDGRDTKEVRSSLPSGGIEGQRRR